jgi:hypothetical protein
MRLNWIVFELARYSGCVICAYFDRETQVQSTKAFCVRVFRVIDIDQIILDSRYK